MHISIYLYQLTVYYVIIFIPLFSIINSSHFKTDGLFIFSCHHSITDTMICAFFNVNMIIPPTLAQYWKLVNAT